MKPTLPFLETMITQSCNLSCHGCTNYSDLKYNGYVKWQDGKHQLEQWLQVIDILDFGIMGGEPLINPEVRQWLAGIRTLLPNAQIRFTTNGELLHRHMDIIDLAHELGNVVFKISVHRNNSELETVIDQIFSNYDWQPVTEYGINRHRTSNNLRFQVNRPKTFIQTYRGQYVNMKPYNNTPSKSFDICIQKTCPLLYNGYIYKCSTQGLLEDLLSKLKIVDRDWDQYIGQAITPGSGIEEIQNFINNFGKPHDVCAMCPAATDKESIIEHYTNVKTK